MQFIEQNILFMKRSIMLLIIIILTLLITQPAISQDVSNSINQISASDLKSHVSFLASPLLKGRKNGEDGLEIAGQYIAAQAKLLGLLPANGESYFQPYSVIKRTIDTDKTRVQVISGKKDTLTLKKPLFQLVPSGPTDYILEGDIVFAGYGIKSETYKYNDFVNLNTEDKILLVMTRAPMSEDGKTFLFEGTQWSSFISLQFKLSSLLFTRARAVLIVMDPKSGFSSFDDQYPDYAEELSVSINLKGEKSRVLEFPGMPKIIFIHREVADALLKDSEYSLEELQKKIDNSLKPSSFLIKGKRIKITEASIVQEKVLNNVAGYIEGSDSLLKREIVVYSAHYDHIGTSGNLVNSGADDNASGCASLLSMAEAFNSGEKKPLRSLLFLWVSGEEIGLYGSKIYVNNPLFPIGNTIANLNMDMIGRVKEVADSTEATPMSGPKSIFVITDSQSKELLSIADEIDKKYPLDFDYSLSGKDHSLQLFARSDHYNFVRKDIPVLFFSTGLHADYHTPRDVIEKLDFEKMEMATKIMYEIGLNIANRKNRLTVDNPFSAWGNNK